MATKRSSKRKTKTREPAFLIGSTLLPRPANVNRGTWARRRNDLRRLRRRIARLREGSVFETNQPHLQPFEVSLKRLWLSRTPFPNKLKFAHSSLDAVERTLEHFSKER